MGQTNVCLLRSVLRACVRVKVTVRAAALQNDAASKGTGCAVLGLGPGAYPSTENPRQGSAWAGERQPQTGTISASSDFPPKEVIRGDLGFALSKTPLTDGNLKTNIILLGYPSR